MDTEWTETSIRTGRLSYIGERDEWAKGEEEKVSGKIDHHMRG